MVAWDHISSLQQQRLTESTKILGARSKLLVRSRGVFVRHVRSPCPFKIDHRLFVILTELKKTEGLPNLSTILKQPEICFTNVDPGSKLINPSH